VSKIVIANEKFETFLCKLRTVEEEIGRVFKNAVLAVKTSKMIDATTLDVKTD